MKPVLWVLVCAGLAIGCGGSSDQSSKTTSSSDGSSGDAGSGGDAGGSNGSGGGTGGNSTDGGGGSAMTTSAVTTSGEGAGGSGGDGGSAGGGGEGGTGGEGGEDPSGSGGSGGEGGSGGAGGSGGGPLGCTLDDVQCNGLDVETCDSMGQWQTSQTCPFVCSGGACTGVCSPTDQQCSGNTPQTCDGNGQWVSGASCQFVCSAGACTGSCVPGSKMCSGTSTQSCDLSGSWAAPVPCPAPAHAGPTCSGDGICGWSCQGGYDNCNGNPGDGCETNLSLPASCGSCGNQCNAAGGMATCSMGSCGIVCDGQHEDCNNSAGDGCEVALGTTSNCLGCGDTCMAPAHAVPVCTGGGCDFACSGLWDDCNGLPGDGCEKDVTADAFNCGGCGISCFGGTCSGGSCVEGITHVADAANVTSLALGTPYAVQEVYWTTSAGKVEKAPASGGSPTTLASGQTGPEGVVTNGVNVVWSNSTVPKAIRSIPSGGGSPTDLVSGHGPVELTHDGTSLFWTSRTAYDPCYCVDSSQSPIYKMGLGGGVPTVINPEVNSGIWPSWPGLVVTGNNVFRLTWETSAAMSVLRSQDKTNTTLYGGAGSGVYVNAVFETFFSGRFLVKNSNDDLVIWATLQTSGPALVKAHDSVSPSLIALTSSFTVKGIAADTQYVYVLGAFIGDTWDRVVRYPLAGGPATYLVNNQYNARHIMVDDTHVYWTIDGLKYGNNPAILDPVIVRMPK